MMKPITGQYECQHTSGIGLDYFTARIDRLTLHPNGRFILIVQDRSRIANAAQSLVSGQQVTTAAPETRREGSYTLQGNALTLLFDDGAQDQGQISGNGEGVQLGSSFFTKVSDSTLLPPTQRMKKDMDDIAKGLKIVGTIGGIAFKAAKTIHETIQSGQTPEDSSSVPSAPPQGKQGQSYAQPPQQAAPRPPAPPSAAPQPYAQPPQQAAPAAPVPPPTATASPATQGYTETIFCDQCGARSRPGKRFCNQCGARLD